MRKQPTIIISALAFSLLIPAFGYFYVGWLIALLFLVGYLISFTLWLLTPTKVSWAAGVCGMGMYNFQIKVS